MAQISSFADWIFILIEAEYIYTWKLMKHKEYIKTGSKVLQLDILNIYYILNQVYRGVFIRQ